MKLNFFSWGRETRNLEKLESYSVSLETWITSSNGCLVLRPQWPQKTSLTVWPMPRSCSTSTSSWRTRLTPTLLSTPRWRTLERRSPKDKKTPSTCSCARYLTYILYICLNWKEWLKIFMKICVWWGNYIYIVLSWFPQRLQALDSGWEELLQMWENRQQLLSQSLNLQVGSLSIYFCFSELYYLYMYMYILYVSHK